MNTKRLFWFATLILSNTLISSAQGATPIEEVLQTFTACNGEFFYAMKNNKAEIAKISPLIEREKSASFAVENRRVKGKNAVLFSAPVEAFGLHLKGYFDEVSSASPKEQFYYWGFYVAEEPDQVRAQLEKYIKNHERLRKDAGSFTRLEVHDGKSWVSIESPQQFSGKVPGSNVERVLIIEKTDDEHPGTSLSCSIQGPVTDIVTADVRPDLPPKDYPVKPSYSGMSFDAVPVPPQVQKVVNTLLKNESLRPKFKTAALRYRIFHKDAESDKDDFFIVETFEATQTGLIKKREIHSARFFVDRLMLWNLIQLKSKLSDSDVYLAHELKVKAPAVLDAGGILDSEVVSGEEYDQHIRKETCTFGDEFPASEIHAKLFGTARKLICKRSIEDASDEYAFVKELGLFVHRAENRKDKPESVYKVIDIDSDVIEAMRLRNVSSNLNASLPKMVDPDTRLDSTSSSASTFHFNYTLVNKTGAEGKKIKAELEDGVTKRICTTKNMLDNYINKQVTLEFTYFGKDKTRITEFSVGLPQCFSLQQRRFSFQ